MKDILVNFQEGHRRTQWIKLPDYPRKGDEIVIPTKDDPGKSYEVIFVVWTDGKDECGIVVKY